MKRIHIHVGVDELEPSIRFYSTVFGQAPSKTKGDYAKWMVDDPAINFAISTRATSQGIDHLGIQVEHASELEQLRQRVKDADVAMFNQGETVCCYAHSDKSWVQDPSGIAWEAYQTMDDAELYHRDDASTESACCTPESKGTPGCCKPSENTAVCCEP